MVAVTPEVLVYQIIRPFMIEGRPTIINIKMGGYVLTVTSIHRVYYGTVITSGTYKSYVQREPNLVTSTTIKLLLHNQKQHKI